MVCDRFRHECGTNGIIIAIERQKNVKIQLWNLGFVEAHQNSILRGQGFMSTRGGWKGHAAFPHFQLARNQSRRQKSAVHEQRQEKAVKRSRTVVAVFKCDRFCSPGPRRLPNMSNATGDESGETNYLHNNRKGDSGDDSAGETSYLTSNRKRPDPDDRGPAAGGGVAGSNIGGSSITTSGGGACRPDLGAPATAARSRCPRGLPCWGTS